MSQYTSGVLSYFIAPHHFLKNATLHTSWKADIWSPGEQIHCLLWNLKIQYREHNRKVQGSTETKTCRYSMTAIYCVIVEAAQEITLLYLTGFIFWLLQKGDINLPCCTSTSTDRRWSHVGHLEQFTEKCHVSNSSYNIPHHYFYAMLNCMGTFFTSYTQCDD
jgi:hypothetical protein